MSMCSSVLKGCPLQSSGAPSACSSLLLCPVDSGHTASLNSEFCLLNSGGQLGSSSLCFGLNVFSRLKFLFPLSQGSLFCAVRYPMSETRCLKYIWSRILVLVRGKVHLVPVTPLWSEAAVPLPAFIVSTSLRYFVVLSPKCTSLEIIG